MANNAVQANGEQICIIFESSKPRRLTAKPLYVLNQMNKLICFLVFLFVLQASGMAQNLIVESKEVEKILFDFLIEKKETSQEELNRFTPDIILVNVLDYSAFDSSKAGIYKFVIFGSHQRPFLLVYENEQIKIIADYTISNVLKKSLEFFERNDSIFSNQQRLEYIENIIDVVKVNYSPPGMLPAPIDDNR